MHTVLSEMWLITDQLAESHGDTGQLWRPRSGEFLSSGTDPEGETPWDAQAKPHKRSRTLFNGLLPLTVFILLIKSRCWVHRPPESGKSNKEQVEERRHVWGVNAEQAARRLLLGMRVHLLSCCQQRPHPPGRWPTYWMLCHRHYEKQSWLVL